MAAYDQILRNATNAYNSSVMGYKTALAQQQARQQAVADKYTALSGSVVKGLEGSSDAARQEIIDQYKAQSDKGQMDLIKKGLGSSTVLNSINRGLAIDQAKAQTNRLNEFAKTNAGYQTQIGLAGLGYEGGALRDNMGFLTNALQFEGEGGLKLAGLAGNLTSEDIKNQQWEKQFNLQKLQQLYGIGGGRGGGGGGGHVIDETKPLGGMMANRDSTTPPYYGGGVGRGAYVSDRDFYGAGAGGYSSAGGDFGSGFGDGSTSWQQDAYGTWFNPQSGETAAADADWGQQGTDWWWEE